jgi:hypothetical protein
MTLAIGIAVVVVVALLIPVKDATNKGAHLKVKRGYD